MSTHDFCYLMINDFKNKKSNQINYDLVTLKLIIY